MSETTTPTKGFFGTVTDVKSIRSLGVTRIMVEVPSEFHVEATSMMFNQDVFMLGAGQGMVRGKYGPLTVDKFLELMTVGAGETASSSTESKPYRTRGIVRPEDDLQISKWLGAECGKLKFMQWIGAVNNSHAAQIVRDLCGVASRSEIAGNAQAREVFLEKIYRPYTEGRAFT